MEIAQWSGCEFMTTYFIMMVFVIQLGVSKLAHGKVVACNDEFYLTQVEMKYLDYDKNQKRYYRRVFYQFPESWSLAHPGLGKLKIKVGRKNLPAEKLKLEYRSLKGELLATKEIKLFISYQENSTYLTTQGDLDVHFQSFFERSKEGKVQISFVANNKNICFLSIDILGILEQTD